MVDFAVRGGTFTINLQAISPEEAVEYARDILELFAPPIATPPPPLAPPVIEASQDSAAQGGCDAD